MKKGGESKGSPLSCKFFLKSVSFESSGIFGKIVSLDEKKDGVNTLLTLKVVRVNQRIWE